MVLGQGQPVDQRQPCALGAGTRKAPAQPDAQQAGLGLVQQRRALPVVAPVAAGALGQAQRAGVDLHTRQRGQQAHHHAGRAVALAADFQAQQVAVELQGIGHLVVVKLGPLVERGGSGINRCGAKQRAVQHDVTVDLADALPAQLRQQGRQLRQPEFGVGAAAQHQITGQHIALLRRRAEQLSKAPVIGAQRVQGHDAGDQLHRR